MTNEALASSALDALGDIDQFAQDGPIRPFRNLIDWIKSMKDTVSQEAVILACESAWDFVAKYNFQQIPDAIEVPLKAFLRAQIRPAIERIYMGS